MQNDARTNVILAVMVLFLALLAWYKPGLQQHQFHYLTALNQHAIETIVIERKGMATIRLSKNHGHWYLQKPYHLPASLLRVNTILDLASKRSYSSFRVNEDELKRYSLAPPLVSVWLNDQRIDLGGEAPLNGQRYALNMQENLDNDRPTVHLINGAVYYQLRASLDSFIAPSLIPPEAEIQQLKWSDHQLSYKDGQWQLKTTPEYANTQPETVNRLIENWQNVQASRVETHIKARIKPDQASRVPGNTIQLTLKQGNQEQTISYVIIQEDKQIKLLREDLQIAWWITPQQLKLLTEFLPLAKIQKNTQ